MRSGSGWTDETQPEIVTEGVLLPGIRDLEQAAEHIAANALYQIEVNHVSSVIFNADMVKKLFE